MLLNRTQRTVWSWLLAVAMVFATVQPAMAGARCCQGKQLSAAQGCCGCCQTDVRDNARDDVVEQGTADHAVRTCCKKRVADSNLAATETVSASPTPRSHLARSCCIARLKQSLATTSTHGVAQFTVDPCECRFDAVPLLPAGTTEKATVEQGHKVLVHSAGHKNLASASVVRPLRAAASAGGASIFPDVQVLYCSWLI